MFICIKQIRSGRSIASPRQSFTFFQRSTLVRVKPRLRNLAYSFESRRATMRTTETIRGISIWDMERCADGATVVAPKECPIRGRELGGTAVPQACQPDTILIIRPNQDTLFLHNVTRNQKFKKDNNLIDLSLTDVTTNLDMSKWLFTLNTNHTRTARTTSYFPE